MYHSATGTYLAPGLHPPSAEGQKSIAQNVVDKKALGNAEDFILSFLNGGSVCAV